MEAFSQRDKRKTIYDVVVCDGCFRRKADCLPLQGLFLFCSSTWVSSVVAKRTHKATVPELNMMGFDFPGPAWMLPWLEGNCTSTIKLVYVRGPCALLKFIVKAEHLECCLRIRRQKPG